jgi:hypothetical protein
MMESNGSLHPLTRKAVILAQQWRLGRLVPRTLLLRARREQDRQDRIARRRRFARGYYERQLGAIEDWAVRDTEDANFYYDLTDANKAYLGHFVAAVTGAPFADAMGWIAELEADQALMAHLKQGLVGAYPQTDIRPAYGRRLGWYAVARASKPAVVVETGVDHGVGACVLCAALLRNAAEGRPGRYYGLDIAPSAGRLLAGPYADVGEMVFGDSIESLNRFQQAIGLFVNDSDHTEDFEAREYDAMLAHLAPDAIVLSDNSHVTDALARFSVRQGRRFLFFREVPKDHWYPGAGIGASFR